MFLKGLQIILQNHLQKTKIKEKLDKLFIDSKNENKNLDESKIKLTSENDTSDLSDAVSYVFDPEAQEEEKENAPRAQE